MLHKNASTQLISGCCGIHYWLMRLLFTYGRSYLHIYLWSVIEGLGIVACRCSTEEDIYIIPTALFAAAVGLRAVRLIEQRIIGSG